MAAVVLAIAACDSVLEIDQGGIIDFDDLDAAGPTAVAQLVAGIAGSYQEAADDVARYAAMITDEMIAAGSFEGDIDVDRRRIQPGNDFLTTELYTPLHVARMQADTVVAILQEHLADPAFDSVETELREGIVLGKLYGAYSRLWLGELYCWSILSGMHPEDSPVLPDLRVEQARQLLIDVEGSAGSLGLQDARMAAIVGQARAQLWLRNYDAAATLAAAVPRDFAYWSEYSFNVPAQFNEVYQFTWGNEQSIHWTIGDGTTFERGNERFRHFDEFVALNLIEVEPEGFTAASSSTPVILQQLYSRPDASILLASGIEARLIRAEAAVRAGDTSAAEALLNDLRSDYSLRATVLWDVDPPAAGGALQPLVLADSLALDIETVAGERARELWLSGDRLTTARRLRRDPTVAIDLFPQKAGVNGGDDIAFPMVQLELEENPALGSTQACPPGQVIGRWR